ncbi:MAG: hypothetical protein HLUCCO16_19770 [Phormidium sp. OSCR]|nr:MAG: hypothetical protein HLUCCO16_19770 [Phormidium sp. OSCR]
MTITGVKIIVNAETPLTGMGISGAIYLIAKDPNSEATTTFAIKTILEVIGTRELNENKAFITI